MPEELQDDLAFYAATQKALFIKQLTAREILATGEAKEAIRRHIEREQIRLSALVKSLPVRLARTIQNA